MRRNQLAIILGIAYSLALITSGFVFGYYLNSNPNSYLKPLRVENKNYQFVSPLLTCDMETELKSDETTGLEKNLADFIESEKEKGNITSASVYIRDYEGGYVANVFPEEKYYPASLGKIPVMLSAMKMEKTDPNFWDKKFAYKEETDYNAKVEVKPSAFLLPGKEYSIKDAVEKMIVFSDNNALIFLGKHIDNKIYNQTFSELKIPANQDASVIKDFMTAKDFSYFLRVLYNATYLDRDDSEEALDLLSKVEYKNGLAKGLPENTRLAHKFGLLSNLHNGNVTDRELHDCGIVYKEDSKPYLICVMTKGTDTLENQQSVIQEISRKTYESLRN